MALLTLPQKPRPLLSVHAKFNLQNLQLAPLRLHPALHLESASVEAETLSALSVVESVVLGLDPAHSRTVSLWRLTSSE